MTAPDPAPGTVLRPSAQRQRLGVVDDHHVPVRVETPGVHRVVVGVHVRQREEDLEEGGVVGVEDEVKVGRADELVAAAALVAERGDEVVGQRVLAVERVAVDVGVRQLALLGLAGKPVGEFEVLKV